MHSEILEFISISEYILYIELSSLKRILLFTVKIELYIATRDGDGHISQIVTGFLMLKKQGKIDLIINRTSGFPFVSIVQAIINEEITVLYDMADGYTFDNPLVFQYAMDADLIFKRSFNASYNEKYPFRNKIHPLGFNYHVTTKGNPLDHPKNGLFSRAKWAFKESLNLNYHQNFYPDAFEDKPRPLPPHPKVLFTARTWSGENNDHNQDETHYMDSMRADIIRKLRKELGDSFIGGFTPRQYAKDNFSDCILPSYITERRNYLKTMKESDICIATMGLFESNGWKLGEYVAASKAIVSEELHYAVPRGFSPNRNYLEFHTVDECVGNVMRLVEDKELAFSLKKNNHDYYRTYLKPDRLIINSLDVVWKWTQEKTDSVYDRINVKSTYVASSEIVH